MSPVPTLTPWSRSAASRSRGKHVLARLEPGDAAHARHVEQDAAADQPVLEDVDRTRLGSSKNEPSNATWQKASMWVCPSLW